MMFLKHRGTDTDMHRLSMLVWGCVGVCCCRAINAPKLRQDVNAFTSKTAVKRRERGCLRSPPQISALQAVAKSCCYGDRILLQV